KRREPRDGKGAIRETLLVGLPGEQEDFGRPPNRVQRRRGRERVAENLAERIALSSTCSACRYLDAQLPRKLSMRPIRRASRLRPHLTMPPHRRALRRLAWRRHVQSGALPPWPYDLRSVR